MPEFSLPLVGVSRTVGSVPASTQGTTITSNASVDTKGSWVELTSATTIPASWVLVQFANAGVGANAAGGRFLVDIGIGAATEQVIIPDLMFYSRGLGGGMTPYLFPLSIPTGSRLSARSQDSTGGQSVEVVVTLFAGAPTASGVPSIVSAYGSTTGSMGTNIDPGGTAHTDSSWVELTASTDRDHHWLVIAGSFGDGAVANARWLFDLGIGAATEQEIVSDLLHGANATNDFGDSPVIAFPYYVPKGSRLSGRVRSTSITDGDRDINIKVYGA